MSEVVRQAPQFIPVPEAPESAGQTPSTDPAHPQSVRTQSVRTELIRSQPVRGQPGRTQVIRIEPIRTQAVRLGDTADQQRSDLPGVTVAVNPGAAIQPESRTNRQTRTSSSAPRSERAKRTSLESTLNQATELLGSTLGRL